MLRHGHVPDLRILALHPRHESFPRHTHYASVDNERETKREKGKRKKLKKKKESNNETTIVSLRIVVIRIVVPFANEKLEFRKHVEETFRNEKKNRKRTMHFLPWMDGENRG